MLDAVELEALVDEIQHRVYLANQQGTLEELLEKLGMSNYLHPEDEFESYPDGKVVIIGESTVSRDKVLGISKEFGITPKQLELCLDYNEAKSFSYRKLQYNSEYRAVLVGPIPHKAEGIGEYSSAIAMMEQSAGFPKVVRLVSGNKLKITKANLKEAFESLIDSSYLKPMK